MMHFFHLAIERRHCHIHPDSCRAYSSSLNTNISRRPFRNMYRYCYCYGIQILLVLYLCPPTSPIPLENRSSSHYQSMTQYSYKTHSPALEVCSELNLQVKNLHSLDSFSPKLQSKKKENIIEILGPTDPTNCAPVIITIGHGGYYKPNYIPNRSKNAPECSVGGYSKCSTTGDMKTIRAGLHIAAKIMQNYGSSNVPYIVISHLHRSKLDVNRVRSAAAQGDPIAE